MEYYIYIDKVFALLLLMNLGVVMGYNIYFRCSATHRRCLCVTAVTTLFQTVVLWGSFGTMRIRFAFGMLVSCITIPLGLLYPKQIDCLKLITRYTPNVLFESFLINSCIYYIWSCSVNLKNGRKELSYGEEILVFGMVCLCVIGFLFIKRNRKEIDDRICCVRIVDQMEVLEMRALVDTGNHLTDPISKKPVSIVSKQLADSLLRVLRNEKCVLIPFKSVGCQSGCLRAYVIPKMYIETTEGGIFCKDAMLAIAETEFGNVNTYQMILHPQMIKEE